MLILKIVLKLLGARKVRKKLISMNSSKYKFDKFYGREISTHLLKVAEFRIRYFKDFPYLYDGSVEYEMSYLTGYADDPRSMLITVTNMNNELIAVSTSVPLVTTTNILDGASELFRSNGLNPSTFFYYGEVIIDHSARKQGLAKSIYLMQDEHALNSGFENIAIATVIRLKGDHRQPEFYQSSDLVWKKMNFQKTNLIFNYK